MVTACACLLSLSVYHTLLSVCGRITVHCVTYNGLLAFIAGGHWARFHLVAGAAVSRLG